MLKFGYCFLLHFVREFDPEQSACTPAGEIFRSSSDYRVLVGTTQARKLFMAYK